MEQETSRPGAAAGNHQVAVSAAAAPAESHSESKDGILPWKVGNIYPVIHGRLSFSAHHDDEHVGSRSVTILILILDAAILS
jgi:hypothetical protein